MISSSPYQQLASPLATLVAAARTVAEEADATGCDEEWTVTRKSAIASLQEALAALDSGLQIPFTLQSAREHPPLKGTVHLDHLPLDLGISFEGFETCAGGEGDLLILVDNFHNGEPTTYIWSDRSQEDPTHSISLSNSRCLQTTDEP